MEMSIIISISSLGLCALFFLYCRAYLKRRTGQEHILAEFREEVYKLITEIDTATDRDATLIEDRIRSLKILLEDVDKRIGTYAQELSRRRASEETYAELGRKQTQLKPSPAMETEPPKEVLKPVRKTERVEPSSPRVIVAPEIKPKPIPLQEQVAELAKAGFSPNLIATRLGVSISEVELAIAIAEQKS
jgi:hypothetical protein